MLFSDLLFVYIFLPLLFLFYYPIKNIKWKNIILLIFSIVFYCWAGIDLFLLMLCCVLINYLLSLIISHYDSLGKVLAKKISLIVCITLDIGILFVFKYLVLVGDTITKLTPLTLDFSYIVLPVGISFYLFQAMSYSIDVYRGDVEVQKNFAKLLLYVSLFPQLIAGPIVRYKDICQEIEEREITFKKVNSGAFRFAIGLAKKVLIANNCGNVAKNLLDSSLESSTTLSIWIGLVFFALQIYYDFSGYSDMAIGLGKMLGFTFKENFNYPYISSSATDFWRRWHISLGTFFRDYLYIPLGGNRHLWLRNVLIVWLVTGLWHGASYNFILWGLYYGILLILEKKLFTPLMSKCNKVVRGIVSALYMIPVTLFGWGLFYYTDDFASRIAIMFGKNSFVSPYELSILSSNVILLVVAIFCATPIINIALKKLDKSISNGTQYTIYTIMKTAITLALIFVSTAFLAGDSYNPFLYFRF